MTYETAIYKITDKVLQSPKLDLNIFFDYSTLWVRDRVQYQKATEIICSFRIYKKDESFTIDYWKDYAYKEVTIEQMFEIIGEVDNIEI